MAEKIVMGMARKMTGKLSAEDALLVDAGRSPAWLTAAACQNIWGQIAAHVEPDAVRAPVAPPPPAAQPVAQPVEPPAAQPAEPPATQPAQPAKIRHPRGQLKYERRY